MTTERRIEDVVSALKAYYPTADVGLIERAYAYSAKVHEGQVRRSGEPYLIHPLEVAYLLTALHLDEASIATGLLHDTVEDTLATLDELRDLFGAPIAGLVDGVTKLSQIRFDTDEHKQAENFRKMLVAMAKDIRVILVKLADRLHNMRTLEHLSPRKQRSIAQETMDIYAPIANRLGIHWMKSELEDRAFSFLNPMAYRELSARVSEVTSQREGYVEEVTTTLKKTLSEKGLKAGVHGRPKHIYSIYKKMENRGIPFEEVYDVIAFRVLCESVGACYEVLGHVHALWHPIPGRFKDYIAMPKANDYQSLHTSVFGPKGERIEIQIRTHDMHRIAEEGIAAHWEYKEEGVVGRKGKQQFAWLRQLLEWQKELEDPNEFLDTIKYDLFADEVFVFTPRGEVISLNRGATPVDFAFAIHTEVGMKCAGAKVNGRIVPLRTHLENGDRVEIITNKNQQPSKDWLKFVASPRAKQKIRNIVRAEERERSRDVGRALLERELKRYGLVLTKFIKNGQLKQASEDLHHNSEDGLYVALGYGRLPVTLVIEKLSPETKIVEDGQQAVLGNIFRKVAPRNSAGVVVQGLADVLVRYPKCCSPLPGDSIVGFVTRGRGVTVHRSSCARALDADPDRRITVSWDTRGDFSRAISLRVLSADKPGILAEISRTFMENGVNIAQANCRVIGEDRAENTFEVLIKDVDQLFRIMDQIRSLNGVLTVSRC